MQQVKMLCKGPYRTLDLVRGWTTARVHDTF